jgi:hypothetical protein
MTTSANARARGRPARPRVSALALVLAVAGTALAAPAALSKVDAQKAQRALERRVAPWVPLSSGNGANLSFVRIPGLPVAPLRLADRPGRAGYVALGTVLAPQRLLTAEAMMNLGRLSLRRGHARALVTVGGQGGHGYAAGPVRTAHGLRWAVWSTLPGGKVEVAVSRRRVRLASWTQVKLRTRWNVRKSRAILVVNGRPVAKTPFRDLTGLGATRANIGLNRAVTRREGGVLFLSPGSWTVTGRRVPPQRTRPPRPAPVAPAPAPPAPAPSPAPLPGFIAGPAPPGTVSFRGDFQTGNIAQWPSCQCVPGRVQVVKLPAGPYAARFEVRQGDDPINSTGNRTEVVVNKDPVIFREGDERWFDWWTSFDSSFPPDAGWQIVTQWHLPAGGTQPTMTLDGRSNRVKFAAGGASWQAPLQRTRWYNFRLHALFSADKAKGFVELWVDGQPAIARTSVALLAGGASNYLKQGYYRNDNIGGAGAVYHAGMVITKP